MYAEIIAPVDSAASSFPCRDERVAFCGGFHVYGMRHPEPAAVGLGAATLSREAGHDLSGKPTKRRCGLKCALRARVGQRRHG